MVSTKARYFASMIDQATTNCFLLGQEIREVPSRKQ